MSSPGLESGSVSTPVYSTYEVKKNQKETKNIDTINNKCTNSQCKALYI